jgi:protein SCO1
MNRTGFRVLGVLLGVFAGTIAAMVTLSLRRPSGESVQIVETAETEEDSEFAAEAAAPDPGNRRQLKELLAATASEPNWTRRFELTERSGRRVKSEELLGEPYIVCFFFSTCPGTCTRQSGEMRLLQSKFKDKPIKLVSISVDPDIDTPEVLREYADKFGADKDRWLFLTGPLEDIIKIGTEMFYLAGVERRGHPDRFCLVDAKGELVGSYVWLDPDERDQLIAHVEELLASP